MGGFPCSMFHYVWVLSWGAPNDRALKQLGLECPISRWLLHLPVPWADNWAVNQSASKGLLACGGLRVAWLRATQEHGFFWPSPGSHMALLPLHSVNWSIHKLIQIPGDGYVDRPSWCQKYWRIWRCVLKSLHSVCNFVLIFSAYNFTINLKCLSCKHHLSTYLTWSSFSRQIFHCRCKYQVIVL